MAKRDTNFLLGWVRQLEQELEDGTELAYRVGEALERTLELVEPSFPDESDTPSAYGDGADVDALDGSDGDGGAHPASEHREGPGGSEAAQLDVPGLVRGMDHVQDTVHRDSGVPRGTGSGASAAVTPRPSERRYVRG